MVHIRKIYEKTNLNLNEKESNQETIDLNGVIKEDLITVNEPDKLLVCSGDPETCVVHSTTAANQKWAFFYNREQITNIIGSLNVRGIRESDLKQTITNEQENLSSLVNATPATQLNPCITETDVDQKLRPKRQTGKPKYEDTNLGYPIEMNTASVLQFALVDNILELEEKLYAGSLGTIKIKDRDAWREDLSNRRFENLDKTLLPKRENPKDKAKKDSKSSRPNSPNAHKDPGRFLGSTLYTDSENANVESAGLQLVQTEDHKLAIESLAIALIQVGQGVESRYLKKPLGKYFLYLILQIY